MAEEATNVEETDPYSATFEGITVLICPLRTDVDLDKSGNSEIAVR